jgi:2,4-dichlorophenol 6-monooxygenase
MVADRKRNERTAVLIVGGGGAGLTASALLSSYEIDSLLVNDRADTSRLPKAHMLNQRTMEIFQEIGLAEEIYRHGTPAENMKATGWYAGLGPAGDPARGRLIGKIEAWGCGYEDPDYVAASPCRSANLPQIRLEPLIRAHAERAAPGKVRFHHELISFEQDDRTVRATIADLDRDEQYTVVADFMIGADAGRTVGPALGISLLGEAPTLQMVTVFMSADLSRWVHDEDVVSYHLVNPDVGSTLENGTLLAAGPKHWGSRSEQWYFHLMYPVGDPAAFDDEGVHQRMRTVMGIPGLEFDVHTISRWTIYGSLAEKFRADRVFLAGDAAHRNPPMGGLGLNSAIGDVHNLCWKLAARLRGWISDNALDSYEEERRPLCDTVIRRALENSRRGAGLHEALGVSPELTPEENWRELREIWEATQAAQAKRDAVRSILARHSMDYRDLNVEVGLPYGPSQLLVTEATAEQHLVDPIRVYQPTTRPGNPLPHAWVEDGSRRVSLRDLCVGRWLLICGENAAAWRVAGESIAQELAVPMTALQVGHTSGDWFDVRCAWLKQREVESTGCVLVRPDRFVAWRTIDGRGDAEPQLRAVLAQLGLASGGGAKARG